MKIWATTCKMGQMHDLGQKGLKANEEDISFT